MGVSKFCSSIDVCRRVVAWRQWLYTWQHCGVRRILYSAIKNRGLRLCCLLWSWWQCSGLVNAEERPLLHAQRELKITDQFSISSPLVRRHDPLAKRSCIKIAGWFPALLHSGKFAEPDRDLFPDF